MRGAIPVASRLVPRRTGWGVLYPPSGSATRLDRHGAPDEGGAPGSSGWDDPVGWIEERGKEDTQGFVLRKS